MDRLPVLCLDNNSARYDGKVWLELLANITEHNGQSVSPPLSLSAFNEGDSVKVQRISKGKRTIWNGRVTYKSFAELSKKQRSSESTQPIKEPIIKNERPVKRKKAKLIQSAVTEKKPKIGE